MPLGHRLDKPIKKRKEKQWGVETGNVHSGHTAQQGVTSSHQARLLLIAQCSLVATKVINGAQKAINCSKHVVVVFSFFF